MKPIISVVRNVENPLEDSIFVLFLGSSPRTILYKDSPGQFRDILEEYMKGEACDYQRIYNYVFQSQQRVQIQGLVYTSDEFTYNGERLPKVLEQKLQSILKVEGEKGLEIYKLFLEQLFKNPSSRSRQELYNFLAVKELPILEDGRFLCYKAVEYDYYDHYSRTVLNTVGSIHTMKRSDVDDDYTVDCSTGFHGGSYQYAKRYLTSIVNGHVLYIAVNPRDVVSVPKSDAEKCRFCEYEVIGEDVELYELLHPIVKKDERGYRLCDTVGTEGLSMNELHHMMILSVLRRLSLTQQSVTIEEVLQETRLDLELDVVLEIIKELGYEVMYDVEVFEHCTILL